MNKPTLNVLGRKHKIVAVDVRNEETGKLETIWDSELYSHMNDNEKADFTQAIENPSKIKEYIHELEDTVKESREYLQELRNQIADTVIENIKLPFPEANLIPIVEEIKGQVTFIEGLELSLDMAKKKVNVDGEVPSTE